MQTAYEKYKEKVKRAAEGRTKREKAPESATDVMKWLIKAVGNLGAVDVSAWTEDEKSAFNQPLIVDSFTEINEMGRFVIESNNVPVACGIVT